MPATLAAPTRPIALWLLLLVSAAAIAGLSAVWAGAAVMLNGNASWMAVVAALDAALLLRLAGSRSGHRRALQALLITLLTVAVAAVLVASAKVGQGFGLRPAEALGRMSFELVVLYVQANVDWVDAVWLALGSALAWISGR